MAEERRNSTPKAASARRDLEPLARYAASPEEKDYWKVYGARYNLLPSAAREILGKRGFAQWKQNRKQSAQEKRFNPQDILELSPLEDEDPYSWAGGPHEWVEQLVRRREEPYVMGVKLAIPKERHEAFELKKLRDMGVASRDIAAKYFGKHFYGQRYREFIENTLSKTMYGTDLDLVDIYPYAAVIEGLLWKLRDAKTADEARAIKDEITNRFWRLALELNKMDAQRSNVDPLETSPTGRSWKRTKRYQILARGGWKALADGLDIRTATLKNLVRSDRATYKERAKLRSAALKRIEEAVRKVTGFSLESEDNVWYKKNIAIRGSTKIPKIPPSALALTHVMDALREAQGKKEAPLSKAEVDRAIKLGMERARIESDLGNLGTPPAMVGLFRKAINDTMNAFIKRHGFDPRIWSVDDAIIALRLTQKEIEQALENGPDYYYKGYVLAKLRRAKEALKRSGAQ